jgi:hypothetical protein
MAMVTPAAEVVDGSVPAISAESPAGISSQQIRSRPPFGAWGWEEKKKDYNIDKVSIQQPQDLTIPQDGGPVPGGFDYVRFALAYHPTTLRD